MKALKIEGSTSKPLVNFNADTGIMKLEGRSIPENPDDFYNSLILWMNKYYVEPQPLTKVEVQLEYINSGSSKSLLELFKVIRENYKEGRECEINWYYEEDDEAVMELGKHFSTIVDVPFNLVEII